MSIHSIIQRTTVPQLMSFKGQQKIVALTAYSAPFARILDTAVDMILVGDSTAMVAYNLPDTLSIRLNRWPPMALPSCAAPKKPAS